MLQQQRDSPMCVMPMGPNWSQAHWQARKMYGRTRAGAQIVDPWQGGHSRPGGTCMDIGAEAVSCRVFQDGGGGEKRAVGRPV